MNFTDDSHKDFFLHYSNVWESYRAHTDFLKNSNRYAQLFDLGAHAYRQWAKGLANAGYASDPQYANKLIAIIQQLGLDQYDLKY
jgi:flagellum-specific peptidoglycan hydrolase FlgJ